MLKIRSIKLTNDSVFGNKTFNFSTRDNRIANIVVLVGENGSGKTRLLKIINFTHKFLFSDNKNENNIKQEEYTKYLNDEQIEIEYEYYIDEYDKDIINFYKLDKQIPDNYYNFKIQLINKIRYQINKDNKVILRIILNIPPYRNHNEYLTEIDARNNLLPPEIKELYINGEKQDKEMINQISSFPPANDTLLNHFGLLSFKINVSNSYILDFYEIINSVNVDSLKKEFFTFYEREFSILKRSYNLINFNANYKFDNLKNLVNSFNNFFPEENNFKFYKIQNNELYFSKKSTDGRESNFIIENLSTGEKVLFAIGLKLIEKISYLNIDYDSLNENYNFLKNNPLNDINNAIVRQKRETATAQNRNIWLNYAEFIKKNDIYLIDEINASLHPKWQNRILIFLKNIFENRFGQIFVTTHSEIIPYNIDIKNDTLINMNEKSSSDIISFKNYKSVQDFVNKTLYVDYEDFVDEYDIWVEGRSDKVILDLAIEELEKNEFIPFNIRFANHFESNSVDKENDKAIRKPTNSFNKLINGSVGVKTQFLSWLSKNNKINKEKMKTNKEIKPKVFIFDNDESGKKSFNKIEKTIIKKKSNTNIKIGLSVIEINWEEIFENNVFYGYRITRIIDKIEEKAFILIYKQKISKKGKNLEEFEIEDFIKEKNYKEIFNEFKGNKRQIENKLSEIDKQWREKLSEWFKDYILSLKKILKINNN